MGEQRTQSVERETDKRKTIRTKKTSKRSTEPKKRPIGITALDRT